MLSTLVIVALQRSRRVFWFSFGHWLSTPWFFFKESDEVGLFFFFLPQKTFFFFLWTVIRDIFIFISCSWPGFFCFFLVPWILVDIRLVNIYIYIYIYIYIEVLVEIFFRWKFYISNKNRASTFSLFQISLACTSPVCKWTMASWCLRQWLFAGIWPVNTVSVVFLEYSEENYQYSGIFGSYNKKNIM